jgi:protein-L-isoaspartate O-methyltransferase
MVVPVGEDGKQKMMRVTKDKDGNMYQQDMGDFSFVPMLQGKNN